MNRRDFLKNAGFGAVLFSLGSPAFAARKSKRPNIVLIMSDDMGISDLGCYGGEIDTPNLDALAAGGLKFKNFYCEPMCIPARATLLTGIYENKSLIKGQDGQRLRTSSLSIGEVLKSAGYATAMSGKWHLGGGDNIPYNRGFDKYFGTIYGAGSFFAPLSLMRDDKNAEHEYMAEDFYYTDAIADNAVDYINQTPSRKPLMLYVAYTAAHWPLHARPADIEKYKGKYAMGWDELRRQRFGRMKRLGVIDGKTKLSPRDPDVPAWKDQPHKDWQQRRMEVYAAQIDSMDRSIGRIIDALRETGRLDDTIVMFTTDNGGCHVEYGPNRKGEFLNETTRDGIPLKPGNIPGLMPGAEDTFQSYGRGWANASNTPYRMFKLYAHQGGIRNPLIVHWPNGIKPGLRGTFCDRAAHMIDIMPTILEAADARHPASAANKDVQAMDGKSFLPALFGKKLPPHDPMFWKWASGKAVIDGKWKLASRDKKPWELYNLEDDPTELNDLADRHPEKAKHLESMWDKWFQSGLDSQKDQTKTTGKTSQKKKK